MPSALNMDAWRSMLKYCPDILLVEFLEFGWSLDYVRTFPLLSTYPTHVSQFDVLEHVVPFVKKECEFGIMSGSLALP